MFLLDRKTVAPLGSEGGPVEEFAILGATANGMLFMTWRSTWGSAYTNADSKSWSKITSSRCKADALALTLQCTKYVWGATHTAAAQMQPRATCASITCT